LSRHLGEFFDKYLVSEALVWKLLLYYKSDTGKRQSQKSRTKKKQFKPFQWTEVKAALKHFAIERKEADWLKDIFSGGEGIRDEKSPRQLRNGYVHSISQHDLREIKERWYDLEVSMNRWLRLFSV
jgi:hypothetical protein